MPTIALNMWERPSKWLSCQYLQEIQTRGVEQGMLWGSGLLVKPVAGAPCLFKKWCLMDRTGT